MSNDFNPSITSQGTFNPDDLLAGDNVGPVTEGRGTLASGQNLARGALLGRITTDGKYTLSLAAASDGSQIPVAILANDANASLADVTNVLLYTAGEFNERRVIFGTGQTAAGTRNALRLIGIHLKDAVPA